jgi:hypothetical protein
MAGYDKQALGLMVVLHTANELAWFVLHCYRLIGTFETRLSPANTAFSVSDLDKKPLLDRQLWSRL